MVVLRVTSRYHRVAIKEPLISTPFLQGWPIHPCIRVTIVVYEKSCPPLAILCIRDPFEISERLNRGGVERGMDSNSEISLRLRQQIWLCKSFDIYVREILREGWIILKIFVHFFFLHLCNFFLLLSDMQIFEDVYMGVCRMYIFFFFFSYDAFKLFRFD